MEPGPVPLSSGPPSHSACVFAVTELLTLWCPGYYKFPLPMRDDLGEGAKFYSVSPAQYLVKSVY